MSFDAAQAIAGENDKASKAIAVAQTIYNTQQAIKNAMANVPAPFNVVQAVAAGVMGAASINTILSTSPGSSSGGAGASSTPNIATAQPSPQMMSGAFELSNTAAPEPMQAYVVSDDITNNQDKLAAIRRRATI